MLKLMFILLERKIALSKTLDNFLNENLAELRGAGLYNVIDPVEGPNGAKVTIAGREIN